MGFTALDAPEDTPDTGSGFTPIDKVEAPIGKTSGVKAFAKSAVESTLPSMAGLAAFGPGAETGAGLGGMVGGPIGAGIGAVIGGLGASYAASTVAGKAQSAIGESIPKSVKEATGFTPKQREQETKEHPYASFAGDLAPNLLTFRPGELEVAKIGKQEISPLQQRALLATAGGGLEATQETMKGEKLDAGKISMAAGMMAVASKPTKLGEKLTNLKVKRAVIDPGHKEWTSQDLKDKWEIPKEINGKPVTVGKVRTRPHPDSLKETAFRNMQTGEIIPSGAKHDNALKDSHAPLEQGFLTHNGDFQNRFEAAETAKVHHSGKLQRGIDYDGKIEGRPGEELKRSDIREPGLHSSDFGDRGLDALIHEPVQRVDRNGRPILGTNIKGKDGKSLGIVIDKDAIIAEYTRRESRSNETGESNPLLRYNIKSPDEYVRFVVAHEEMHNNVSRPDFVPHIEHERLVNELAMEKIEKEGPERAPDAGVPPIPESNQDLADTLFAFSTNKVHDTVIATKLLQVAEQDGLTLSMKDKIQKFAEGTPGVKLTPQEEKFYKKYYEAPALERRALIKHAQDKGWILPTEMNSEIAGENAARETIKPELTPWEKLKKTLADPGKGGFDQDMERTPGGAQERGYFVIESPKGKRTVIQSRGGKVYGFNKERQSIISHTHGDVKPGDKIGSFSIKEARVAEIEEHTPTRYNKDSQAVLYKRLTELREFVRAHEFIENLKGSDYFKENTVAVESGKNPPAGYQLLKNTEKIPQFRNYAFKPRTAEIIDDFSKVWTPNALTLISGSLVKNMMLNPLPHMLNEAWHVYNARGLSGWVSPVGIQRFVQTGMPAIREVMQQGPQFRSMLKDGASLLSADVRNSAVQEEFFRRGAREFMNTPEAGQVAKKFGMSLGDLYNTISKKSSIAMWSVRDAMYMQQINEKMKYEGLTQKEAITEVEKHLPNYRIQARVGEKILGGDLSRGLSQILQNPNVSVFSRYHYGMVNSMIHTAEDLTMSLQPGKTDLKRFAKGVDTALAMGVAMAVLFPLQDKIAQMMTGNENAEQRRAGPFHVIDAIQKVVEGKKDGAAILAAMFTFNPMLLMAGQLAFNRKLYNGQPVYNPGSEIPDLEKYFAGSVPQLQTTLQVSDEKTGGGIKEWTAKQLDIKAPTEESVRKMSKMEKRNKTAAENRRRKRENQD